MKKYGWFEYQEDPLRIRNYLTGQQLVISSMNEESGATAYVGRYTDGELDQLVRFSIGNNAQKTKEIRFDYGDSFSEPPPYGHWRRIDDFIVDALLCWPKYLEEMDRFFLCTTGGWRSGVWQPQFRREFSSRKSGKPDQLTKYIIAEPYVIPLETPAPPAWRLVDVDNSATEASLKFERLPVSNVPFLSRNIPVEGFQGLVPFLERDDKAAYIIFSKLQPASFRGEDPETHLYYTYIDQDIFFRFRSHPSNGLELGTCIAYGFREFPPRREIWTTKPLGEPVPGDDPRPVGNVLSDFSHLSYSVWLRALHTIGDAWTAWGAPRKRVEVDKQIELPSNLGRSGCIGDYGPRTTDGFSGGMRNSWFEVRYPDAKSLGAK